MKPKVMPAIIVKKSPFTEPELERLRTVAGNLNLIRDYIADNARSWARIVNAKKVKETGGIKGDSLKRPPRGFDAQHMHIEDLKRKSFYVMTEAPAVDALNPGIVDAVTEAFRRAAPLNRFINGALDLPF